MHHFITYQLAQSILAIQKSELMFTLSLVNPVCGNALNPTIIILPCLIPDNFDPRAGEYCHSMGN